MENQKTLADQPMDNPGADFRLLRYMFVRHRNMLVLSGIIGLIFGYIYLQTAPETYQIGATVLIREDNKNPELKNVFRQLNIPKKTNSMEDQIGLLKSQRLNLLAVQQLNWTHQWSIPGWPMARDLYPEEPFVLELPTETSQRPGIPIRITVDSPMRFRIQWEWTETGTPEKKQYTYNQIHRFDEPINHDPFHFTLRSRTEAPPIPGNRYELEFIDPLKLADQYKQTLVAERFNPLAESNLIRIKLNTGDPKRDVTYLNQLLATYLRFSVDEKNKAAENTIRFIDNQISTVNESLESAGKTFTNFKSTRRTVNLELEASTMVGKQSQVETELAELNKHREYLFQIRDYLEKRGSEINLIAPAVSGFSDDALKTKVNKLNDLLTRRQSLSSSVHDQSPVLVGLNEEIRFARKMLLEHISNVLSQLDRTESGLLQKEKEIKSALARLPSTEKDLVGMKRNFDLNNELYTFLLERRTEAEISRASADSDAQILDPAALETMIKLGPMAGFDLTLGLVFGLMAGVAFVLVRYFASDTIGDADEVYARLDITPVGEIPSSRINTGSNLFIDHPRSSLAEAFRGLRLNLSELLRQVNGKVIGVHSFLPGAGKSFVAQHLAETFSMQKKKVVLIDGDLIRPVLHHALSMPADCGLRTYFSSDATSLPLIQHTKNPWLDFIASHGSANPESVAPDKEKTQALISDLKLRYDVVIIDNAPISLIHDPKIFGAAADLNLFVLRLNHSRKSELLELNRLGKNGALPGIAAAINGKEITNQYGYYLEPVRFSWLSKLYSILPVWTKTQKPRVDPTPAGVSVPNGNTPTGIFDGRRQAGPARRVAG